MPQAMSLYEQDFCAWLARNADFLKQGQIEQVDMSHLLEELDDMGANQHHALENRLRVLLAHLLKWQYQPNYRSRSWNATLFEQRVQIGGLLDRSPSLKSSLVEKLDKAYPKSVKLAAKETGLEERIFPKECPYTLAQILDEDYYPDSTD
jgi:hypothetical protein